MTNKKKPEKTEKDTKEIVEEIKKRWENSILIPLISKEENDPEFIGKAVEGAKGVVLLLVIDTEAMSGGFGFAASEISHGNQLIKDVKSLLAERNIDAEDILEWGNTKTKIEHIAKLRQVKKIVLKKQDNHYFKKLVESLKENKLNTVII